MTFILCLSVAIGLCFDVSLARPQFIYCFADAFICGNGKHKQQIWKFSFSLLVLEFIQLFVDKVVEKFGKTKLNWKEFLTNFSGKFNFWVKAFLFVKAFVISFKHFPPKTRLKRNFNAKLSARCVDFSNKFYKLTFNLFTHKAVDKMPNTFHFSRFPRLHATKR